MVTRAALRSVDNEGNVTSVAPPGSAIAPNNPESDPANLIDFTNSPGATVISSSDPVVAAAIAAKNAVNNSPTTTTGLLTQITDYLKSQNITLQDSPNVLNNFANYTYHIKLSFTGDIFSYSLKNGADYQTKPKEVIAESGVTDGFNIKDFELTNHCSPGGQIGIMQHTTWKMTLSEPYGLSLIDKLYTASQSIGISNHLTCPYFIEIWFTGYNEDGTIANLKINPYKIFRCTISSINVNATEGGSVYSIEGLVDGTLGTSDEFAMPANGIKISNATTMGKFFQQLSDGLNAQNRSLQLNRNGRRIEYVFKMPKEWESWKLTRDSADPSRTTGWTFKGFPATPEITLPKGTDISNILLAVMSMTEEGKKYTLGKATQVGTTPSSKIPGQPNSSAKPKINTESSTQGTNRIPFIYTSIKLIGYNYLIKDYVREVTFNFLDYVTTRGFTNRKSMEASQSTAAQQARLKNFISTGRLKKIYNYIFTGKNTDITKFDIKLENFWTATQPISDGENTGANYSIAPAASGQTVANDSISQYDKATQDADAAKAKVDALTQDPSSVTSSTSKEYNANALKVAQQENAAAQANLAKIQAGKNQTSFESRFVSPSDQTVQVILSDPTLIKKKAVLENIASLLSAIKQDRKDRYLEDISPAPPKNNPLPPNIFTSNAQLTQINGLYAESVKDQASSSTSPTMPKSRGLLASVINNVVSTPFFVKINLEIRGDPYWMGLGSIDDTVEVINAIDGASTSVPTNGDAFFGNGEVAFLLFFRTGEEPSETTGFVEFDKDSWAFNGIYCVMTVTNKFQNGQFTQVLEANKDVGMYSIFGNNTQQVTSDAVQSAEGIEAFKNAGTSKTYNGPPTSSSTSPSPGTATLNGLAAVAGSG